MYIKVEYMKEEEINQSLRSGNFFVIHHDWSYGGEWEELQYEKIDRLREKLISYPENLAWVDDNTWPNDSNRVEVAIEIVNKKLFKVFYDFLCEESSTCIVVVIWDKLENGKCIGRIIFKIDTLVIEDELTSWWFSNFGSDGIELDL
jgi:hypothetical protein